MSSLLIQNLQKTDLYSHKVNNFKVFETHSAWIIGTGAWVYKIKKNVNFGFLDYSSLEKRHFYCEQEVKLNALLTEGLYDSVVPIYGDELQPSFAGSKVIEYAIKMREFPQENLFNQLLEDGKLTNALIFSLAEVLANFHQRTEKAENLSEFGHAEQLHQPTMENFSETIALLKDPIKIKKLEMLAELTQLAYLKAKPIFVQRKTQGFIRQCHGDVYLKNIVFLDNKPVLFDRIEFNPAFMWTDTMADLGFLLMDLEENGATLAARQLRSAYMKFSGDYHGLQVLPYYSAYRAMVRAKVDQICLLQEAISPIEKEHYNKHYDVSLQLVQNYLSPKIPQLIILYGFTGSGKSTIAQSLLEQHDAIHLQADAERKRIFNQSLYTDTTADLHQGIYSAAHTEKVYQHLLEMTNYILAAGYTAIVDATFLAQPHRQLFQNLAQEKKVEFQIIHCTAPEAILRQRIVQRSSAKQDISNSTVDVLAYQMQHHDSLTENELKYCLQIK
jgi:aminoglycoside phosphotransferase family enzyme/predicted kinase